MWYLVLKAAISGVLIAAASEMAKRYPGFGALIASLPLVSVLGMMWLWKDKPDAANMAAATGVPSVFWVLFWIVIAFVIATLALRAYVTSKEAPSQPDLPFEDTPLEV